MSTWSDEPPKEPGWYWLRYRGHEQVSRFVGELDPDEEFGPRVPTAEELVGLYAAKAELAEIKRAWGMRDEKGEA